MKLFKSTLFIIALCAIGSVSAKKRGAAAPARGRAASAPQQAPASDVQDRPFSYYFAEVRKMPANKVIDANGVFTDSFENFVKSANLAPEFARALMNAGRCLYLPLTGNNDQDVETFLTAGNRINELMSGIVVQYKPGMAIVPYEPNQQSRTVSTEMYDIESTYLNQNLLEQRIEQLMPGRNAAQIIAILSPELKQYMGAEWKNRNIKVTPDRLRRIQDQINTAVNKMTSVSLQPLTPIENLQLSDMPELYYDAWTTQLNQDYLEGRAKELLATKNAPATINILLPELGQMMRKAWTDNNVENTATRSRQLEKQIKDTVNRLALTSAGKVGVKAQPLSQPAAAGAQRVGAIQGTPLSQEAVGGAPEEETMKDRVEEYVMKNEPYLREKLFTMINGTLNLANKTILDRILPEFTLSTLNQFNLDIKNASIRNNLATIVIDKIVDIFQKPFYGVVKPQVMKMTLTGYKATLPKLIETYINRPLPAIPQQQ
jgi:hypothetical protein